MVKSSHPLCHTLLQPFGQYQIIMLHDVTEAHMWTTCPELSHNSDWLSQICSCESNTIAITPNLPCTGSKDFPSLRSLQGETDEVQVDSEDADCPTLCRQKTRVPSMQHSRQLRHNRAAACGQLPGITEDITALQMPRKLWPSGRQKCV